MGLAFCLIRATPETIAALKDRPRAVEQFIVNNPARLPSRTRGLLSRLFSKAPQEQSYEVPQRRHDDEIDLDKAWHVIHFLLTGSTEPMEGPLGLIVDNSHPLADIEVGAGPPNVISPDKVKAFYEAAAGISDEAVLMRFEPLEMPLDDLYLGEVIKRGEHEEMKEYALENFHSLRAFARDAAEANEAMITFYT